MNIVLPDCYFRVGAQYLLALPSANESVIVNTSVFIQRCFLITGVLASKTSHSAGTVSFSNCGWSSDHKTNNPIDGGQNYIIFCKDRIEMLLLPELLILPMFQVWIPNQVLQ
jgi:hypothetical protein